MPDREERKKKYLAMDFLHRENIEHSDAETERNSIPESATPRPYQSSRRNTAGIGSGATPSFQPRQSVTPLKTDLQCNSQAPDTPLRSSSSYSTYQTQPFLTPDSQQYSSESWTSSQYASHSGSSHVSAFSPQSDPSPRDFNVQHHSRKSGPPLGQPYDHAPQHNRAHLQYRRKSQNLYEEYDDSPSNAERTIPTRQLPRGPSSHYPRSSSHSNSMTWVSEGQKEHERWTETENNLCHMELIPRSPFVPHNYEQWLEHRHGRIDDKRQDVIRAASLKARASKSGEKIAPAFGGRTFEDGGGAVLNKQTVFHEPFQPNKMRPPREVADWPCREEMREEGDERNTSRFGRFLGLPRAPPDNQGNPHWKARKRLEPTDMDDTWSLPTRESYEESMTPMHPDAKGTFEKFLGQTLMEGLECELNSKK